MRYEHPLITGSRREAVHNGHGQGAWRLTLDVKGGPATLAAKQRRRLIADAEDFMADQKLTPPIVELA